MSEGRIPTFSINLPDGWEDQSIHLFKGPEDSGIQHMVQLVVDPETGGVELEEYARSRIDATVEALQGAEVVKSQQRTLGNGQAVYECVYKWIPTDNAIIFRKTVFMIIDGRGYTFTGNFSKKTIKTIGVEMEQIIESFRAVGTGEED